ncbi:phospholipase A-2-activating protein [Danaus plexippus]|uniref:phospholipase A-2-activating protein n=1 Tax=Danaus plexippus TaxID=13037 RepID=UPI002AB102D9|nr:phospholipase A-2-activating protein [Danaus plexippus]
MAIPEYKLSSVLCGHSMDVRCVATTKESCILSASRDRTARLWHPEGTKDFVNVVTYKGHDNFVSCVCWLPPCEAFPEGLVVTGSNDNTILGYNLQDGAIQIHLKGHNNAVCSVAPGNDSGILLSASWDNTSRIWNINSPQMSPVLLKGHQAAVWCVIELSNGVYATASADKTIKLWRKDGALINTLSGHTDCVRGLTVASSESFLSCSNDASIKLWSNKGDCINTYYGHSNYVYGISSNPESGMFASCGEDGALRLWSGTESIALRLPAHSVWSIACLNNGDVVTGSSDGIIRVFTKDPVRFADETTLKNYEEDCKKMIEASQQEIGGFKLSELPGPEVLLEPGRTDGQTKLVRRGASVKCYAWRAAGGTWEELGDVMGSTPPTQGKTMYQGQEYDFVFSVDIKDGAPPIKLPFNKTEDPWVAAQAFIHKHELPQVYLEQVANFIITNAKLDSVPASSNGYADPFTGESRYVPSSASPAGPTGGLPTVSSGPLKDPFTGEGAYTTSSNEKPLIPHDAYIRFDAANLKAIHDKLKEFNSKVGDGLNAFTDEQIENIVKLGEMDCTFNPETVTLLKKMLEWPKEILFPVLDVTRLAVRNKDINTQIFDTTYGPNFVKYLLTLLSPDNLSPNQLLSIRVLVNAFSALSGEMLVLSARERLLETMNMLTNISNNAQIAAMSLLLNLSVALCQQPDNIDLADSVVNLLNKITDNEAYFRGLVALGTLLAESPNKLIIQTKIVTSNNLHNRLKRDSSTEIPNFKKISICSQQILRLL